MKRIRSIIDDKGEGKEESKQLKVIKTEKKEEESNEGKDEVIANMESCCGCGEQFDVNKPIEKWQTGCARCENCGDCWCYKSECWANAGAFCADCDEFECYNCEEIKVQSCEECLELRCQECGDYKPAKGGREICYACQPWWMKGKSRSCFCKCCGSQRGDAHICTCCGDRVCGDCIFKDEARVCCRCDDFACGLCCIKLDFKPVHPEDEQEEEDEIEYTCGDCADDDDVSADS